VKIICDPSKRLSDVLKNLLDYQKIVTPFNLIYEKLLNEKMIEPDAWTISSQVIKKVKHKLTLLTVKLPQLRYRQNQFHQPCICK
jgi:hypothetical protein